MTSTSTASVKSLTGESVFSPEMLKSAIDTQEAKRKELQKSLELAHVDLDAFEISEKAMAERLDEMLSWASIYDEAPMPQKKIQTGANRLPEGHGVSLPGQRQGREHSLQADGRGVR